MNSYKPSSVLPGATEIPSSIGDLMDGRSSGFDHNKPGIVVIDPDDANSIVLDMRQVSREALEKASSSSLGGSDYFQRLAEDTKRNEVANATHRSDFPAEAAVIPLPAVAVSASSAEEAAAFRPSHPQPGIDASAIKAAFSTLGIPFLASAVPAKPAFTVYFEFAQLGTMSARYHQVVDAKECLVLVYDSRFEYGQQYLPPNLGPEQTISVGVAETGSSYNVASLGLSWTLGCLDFVLLIKA
jgi:hypothetical protein